MKIVTETETGGGGGSETESVVEGEGKKNRRPVSMPASPRNSGEKKRAPTIYMVGHNSWCFENLKSKRSV